MPTPKRRHSKQRKKLKRNSHYVREVVQVKETKKGYKRPHVEEKVKID